MNVRLNNRTAKRPVLLIIYNSVRAHEGALKQLEKLRARIKSGER